MAITYHKLEDRLVVRNGDRAAVYMPGLNGAKGGWVRGHDAGLARRAQGNGQTIDLHEAKSMLPQGVNLADAPVPTS